jgi:hypothetical protein
MKTRLLITLTALIGIMITATAQIPNYVPTNGLLAWWPLDNSGNDQSVNANHFQNFGMTFTTDRFNNPNSAAIGNGSSQYMVCNTPSFTLGQNSTFTISFWLHQPTIFYGVCLMHGTTTVNNFIWNFQTSATGGIQFGTNKQQSTWIWTQSTHSLNAWDHYVGTYNNGMITLFKNGVVVATNTFTHTGSLQVSQPIYLGRGVSGAYYAGKLDDVGMWNRVLTALEITDLYNGGCAVSYSTNLITACESYTWPQNNQTYTQTGLYRDTLMNHLGCDSVITLDLTILGTSQSTQFELACNSFTWINGITYTASTDTATHTVTGSNGCDSIITLDLTLLNLHFTQQPVDAQKYLGANATFTVATSPTLAMYRWQTDVGGGFQNLMDTGQYSGAFTSTLTVSNIKTTNHGQQFRCITTIGDCKDTSQVAVINALDIGIGDDNQATGTTLFPNPATDQITLQTSLIPSDTPFTIHDLTGRILLTGTTTGTNTIISIETIPAGTYILSAGEQLRRRFSIAR